MQSGAGRTTALATVYIFVGPREKEDPDVMGGRRILAYNAVDATRISVDGGLIFRIVVLGRRRTCSASDTKSCIQDLVVDRVKARDMNSPRLGSWLRGALIWQQALREDGLVQS